MSLLLRSHQNGKLVSEAGSLDFSAFIQIKTVGNLPDIYMRTLFSPPGRQLDGIYFAMSFLERWQRKQTKADEPVPTALTSGESVLRLQEEAADLPTLAYGKRVVVIGGGDTGVDCIATATRMVRDLLLLWQTEQPYQHA